jgi:hypothetical protein
MKKYFLLYKILLLSLPGFAQLTISSGTQWVNNGAVTVTIGDLNFANNGTFVPGNSVIKFGGDSMNTIGGNSLITFYELQIAKNGNKSLSLLSNININSKVSFNSGLFDLNQKNLILAANAILNNESETSHIIGPNGGEVSITMNMNKPNNVNAGNLGAVLTSNSNLGNVTINRGHKNQSGTGLSSGINRYFNIQLTGKKIKASTMRMNYFDAELNSQDENNLAFYQSLNNGANWTNQSFTTRNVQANWVEKAGMTSFELLTLSSNAGSPPPIVNNNHNSLSENDMTVISSKKITVGPNPNNGSFWFKANGIEKETVATLYTIDGKVLGQFRIMDQQQQQVNGLSNGMYLLKVLGIDAFKIIVHGSSNAVNNVITSSPMIKN